MTANAPEARRLEARLVLHGWMNRMLGYASTKELLEDLEDVDEGFDGEGRSGVCRRLLSREGRMRIPRAALEGYDENIRRHVAQVNARRAEPVVLKYFQHLAALYTEILLDNRFDNSEAFLASLNEYAASLDGETMRFSEGDLDRCAFWMATGSGKTLLMHINYRQFLHYNGDEPLDNILLITPNERLTAQHLDEMRLSGIPCERFEPESPAVFGDVVRATEITKIKENLESDKGVSVDVDSFEGRNLIFVDEGHKGAATGMKPGEEDSWINIRRRLASGGYTFEYSATFGQALAKSTSKSDEHDLITAYGKSIVFDYSYRFFYGDGYGKDFRLLNIKDSGAQNTDTLLAGNLLSFYEQRLRFDELGEKAGEYNLKSPLWILIGSKVNAVYSENKQEKSDVYDVLSFLHHFIRNRDGWAEAIIERVLEDDGLFADYFPHLEKRLDGTDSFRGLHRDILRRVFRAGGGGGLAARTIRGSDGQIGLGVSGSEEPYFGLVYVGEPKKLNDLIEERDEGISVGEDVIGGLFGSIDEDGSPVNILVGARKFVEGWSSWRVSSMGLINVGKGEGPMIIQLFGRGVRLQGRNFSLKRSGATDGEHPEEVAPVETLGVFGLKADFMKRFEEALAREDVDPNGYETLPPLPIEREDSFFEEGLLVPRPPDEDFADHENIFLERDENITVALDLSTRFETGGMADGGDRFESRSAKAGAGETGIEAAYLDLLDWSHIHHDLLELKAAKGFRNLVIPPDAPENLMRRGFYKLVCEESVVKPESFEGLARLRDVAVSLLGKYVEKFYHSRQQRWDSERMGVEPLARNHKNLFPAYKVMVKRSREDLKKSVENLISQADEIYEDETEHLPRVYFDRHIYQPLLLEGDDDMKSTPAGLKESERVFVEKLRNYCRAETNGDGKVFLLRNLSRGKGIGFFKTAGFYPDFIVWSKSGEKQRIVFVEPHGMRNDMAPDHNDKIQLHRDLEEISARLSKEPGHEGVELDSFMVSATPFEDLKKQWNGEWKREDFAEEHILFEDDLEERMPLILHGDERKIIPAP